MTLDKALIMLVALTFGTLLNCLLKMWWHEPRPYFLSSEIRPFVCKAVEYGMPSGHSMGFILVYRTFVKLITSSRVVEGGVILVAVMVSYNRG
jgi:membrane-associated phospholipid phosphatase